MKKMIALSCLTALLLAGCGVDEPSESVSVPEPVEVRTTEARTEPETEPETEPATKKVNASDLKLSKREVSLEVGDTDAVVVQSYPSDDIDETDEVWKSLDPAIAKVDSIGHITGVSKGETYVTLSFRNYPEIEAKVKVIVSESASTTTGKASGKVEFSDRQDAYPELYKAEVQRVWDEIYDKNDGMVSIDYALYDIDNDKIPELLFKHGTCEADYVIDIYTVDLDAKLKNVAMLGGGHTSFAYDNKTRELVLVWGHMGAMSLEWYTMDDDFNVKKTKDYSHEFADGEDYDQIMFDKDIWNMDFVGAYCFGKDYAPKSYIYYAYSEYEEYDGLYLDFSSGWNTFIAQ